MIVAPVNAEYLIMQRCSSIDWAIYHAIFTFAE